MTPRQGRQIQLHRPLDQPGISTDISLRDDQDAAKDQVGGSDIAPGSVAHHPGSGWQETGEGIDGLLGLPLLEEGEAGVAHDDHDHSQRQRRPAARPRKRGSHHQQDGQRLRELAQQLTSPLPT